MPKRTFTTDFSVDIDASTRLNFPAGWSGEVDEDIAAAADKAGATDKPAKAAGKAGKADKDAAPADTPADPPADADAPPA